MNPQKLTDIILLSIQLEQQIKGLERDIERIKKRRAEIRAILTKYQDVNYKTEMLFI